MPPKKRTIDFSKIKWGMLTKQAKARGMTLTEFANFVINANKNPKKYKYKPTTTTVQRAKFYLNVIKKS